MTHDNAADHSKLKIYDYYVDNDYDHYQAIWTTITKLSLVDDDDNVSMYIFYEGKIMVMRCEANDKKSFSFFNILVHCTNYKQSHRP